MRNIVFLYYEIDLALRFSEILELVDNELTILNALSITEHLNARYQNQRRFQTCLKFVTTHQDFCFLRPAHELLTHAEEARKILPEIHNYINEIKKRFKQYEKATNDLEAVIDEEKNKRDRLINQEKVVCMLRFITVSKQDFINQWFSQTEPPTITQNNPWRLER